MAGPAGAEPVALQPGAVRDSLLHHLLRQRAERKRNARRVRFSSGLLRHTTAARRAHAPRSRTSHRSPRPQRSPHQPTSAPASCPALRACEPKRRAPAAAERRRGRCAASACTRRWPCCAEKERGLRRRGVVWTPVPDFAALPAASPPAALGRHAALACAVAAAGVRALPRAARREAAEASRRALRRLGRRARRLDRAARGRRRGDAALQPWRQRLGQLRALRHGCGTARAGGAAGSWLTRRAAAQRAARHFS